jgi:hypothetical protein
MDLKLLTTSPNLLELGKVTETRHLVYTPYREYHQLLCLLLLGYRSSVKKLDFLKEVEAPPEPKVLSRSIPLA